MFGVLQDQVIFQLSIIWIGNLPLQAEGCFQALAGTAFRKAVAGGQGLRWEAKPRSLSARRRKVNARFFDKLRKKICICKIAVLKSLSEPARLIYSCWARALTLERSRSQKDHFLAASPSALAATLATIWKARRVIASNKNKSLQKKG
jgi:hypothetical protein